MTDPRLATTPWRWVFFSLALLWSTACSGNGHSAPVQVGLLTYGETVTQAFSGAGQEHRWSFVGHSGDIIDVILQPSGIAPTITLRAPGGETIEQLGGGGHQAIALFHHVVLPAPGTYEITVVSGANESGTYTLTLNQLPPVTPTSGPVQAATATPSVTLNPATPAPIANTATVYFIDTPLPTAAPSLQLTPYRTVEGQLAQPGDIDRYTFFGRADQSIAVGMTAPPGSPVDPYLTIYTPAGNVLAEIDNAFGSADAILTDVIIPATGAYVIFARDAGHSHTGPYAISYGGGHTMRDTFQAQAAPEAVYTGTISQLATRDVWELDLRLGDVISIAVVVADDSPLDPVISLITPGGQTLFRDDNSGGGRSAALRQIIVPQDGRHWLAISPASLAAIGPYTLIWRYDAQAPTPAP